MEITIQEALEYRDLPSDLKTWVVAEEIIEGVRAPLVFTQLLKEFSLVGQVGRRLTFPLASQLSATNITGAITSEEPESTLATSGFTATDKTISRLNVDVTNLVYCATEISDVIQEDCPNIDFARLNLRNAGAAIGEYIETAARDLFAVGAGVTETVGNATHANVLKILTKFKNANWIPDPRNKPFLVISPDVEEDLLTETTYTNDQRYTTSDLTKIVQGESGKYCGCRVLVSPLLDGKPYAIIVYPNNQYGTIAAMVWKRKLKVRSEYDAKTELTFTVSSVRYGMGIVQSAGVGKLNFSTTP